MLYTTTVLTERINQHKEKIIKIKNFDSPQLDIEEAADEIVNHENSIAELEKAIIVILEKDKSTCNKDELMIDLDDKRIVGVTMDDNMWNYCRKEAAEHLLDKYIIKNK